MLAPGPQAAGSAEAFKKVDLHYVEAAAKAAAAAGVPHFSLVSAQGARAGLWASDLKPFHGLLYAKTKGLVRVPLLPCRLRRLSPYGRLGGAWLAVSWRH